MGLSWGGAVLIVWLVFVATYRGPGLFFGVAAAALSSYGALRCARDAGLERGTSRLVQVPIGDGASATSIN